MKSTYIQILTTTKEAYATNIESANKIQQLAAKANINTKIVKYKDIYKVIAT